jgi:hypothetical protein
MGEPAELDIADPYDCFAFMYMEFVCSKCGQDLDVSSVEGDLPSPNWFHAAGLRAKQHGWYLPPPGPDGSLDMTLYCPGCSQLRQIL